MRYCIAMPNLTNPENIFPIGIAYVASSLRASGREVVSVNLRYSHEPLEKILLKYDIDFFATGGLTSDYSVLHDLFKKVKYLNKDIVTCAGGGIITSDPVHSMIALEYVDYGIIGEGEKTICELAEALERKHCVDSVDGVIYYEKDSMQYKITKPRSECIDLDSLPYPDYEGFQYGDVLMENSKNPDVPNRRGMVSFSRSCPFSCSFCFHPAGTKYRRRSVNSVLKEIDYLKHHYGIESLVIVDELFMNNRKDAMIFCQQMKKRNLGFNVCLRVNMVDRELLQMLKDSGCYMVGFGLESADSRVLKSMNKHITVEDIDRALRLCHEIGLFAYGMFIFGDQAENYDTVLNTLTYWKQHPEYSIGLDMITVYPGSLLYHVACKKGIISDKVAFIREGCPLINVSNLSNQEYQELALKVRILPRVHTDKIQSVYVKYRSKGKVDFTAMCPKCGALNEWNELNIFYNGNGPVCGSCGKRTYMKLYPYFSEMLRHNYNSLDRKIAFWPIAYSAGEIFEALPEILTDKKAYLIDSSPEKYGLSYEGKHIYSPDILKRQQIDTVFLTSISSVTKEIVNIIRSNFQFVKYVMFAGELADNNFILRNSLRSERC